jgi:hypothetical protein
MDAVSAGAFIWKREAVMDALTVVCHIAEVKTCFWMLQSGSRDNLPQDRSLPRQNQRKERRQ